MSLQSSEAAPTRSGRFLKRGALLFVLGLLLLPGVQAHFGWVPVGPLSGFFDPLPEAPTASWQTLRDNSFQKQAETYLEMNLGFRSWLLRLHNQLLFSCFGQSRARGLLVGKDNQFYGLNSVNSYFGRDFASEEVFLFQCKRLRRVQDSLQAHGTQLLVVLAPGKARLLPHQMPDSCDLNPVPYLTNLDVVSKACVANGVNLLDAARLMSRWQDTTHYPLFPRGGVHWSGYAVTLIADTLFRRLEHLTHHDLPDFSVHGGTIATRTDELRFTDNDLQQLFNLVHDVPPYPVLYPNVVFGPTAGKQRINALVIGDSFAQSFYNFYPYYQHLLTPESRYWASNEYIYWPLETPESRAVHDLNLTQQLAGRNVVLLICTEQNLVQFGFGFFEQAFDRFCPRTARDTVRIQAIEQGIRDSPEWLGNITRNAQANHKDVNQLIHDNALYMQDRER